MNDRKKILFLVTQSEFGGAQRFIYTLINNLKNYDIVVSAGTEGDDTDGLLNLLGQRGIKIERLKNLRRSINPFFDLLGLFEIIKLLKKEKPDILFLCSTKAGFLGSFAASLVPSPKSLIPKVIYRIGGWTFNDPWPKWKKQIYILIEKYTAKLKDVIINNAKSDTRQAIDLGIKPKKEIVTIYNGIDVEGLELLSKEKARENLSLGEQDFIVGTIANFYSPKGLEYLIESANILKNKNIKFVIIGEGEERGKLENLIKKRDLGEKIFLTGAMLDASKYLKAFDVFVLPSVKEGFPWAILEAMSAEIPVIATKVGAVPDIIVDGENGILIEPGKPEQITEAVEKLLNNPDLREKLAKAGKETVIEKFGLEKMINEFVKLFDA